MSNSDIEITQNLIPFVPIKNSIKKHILFFQSLEKISSSIISSIPQVEHLRLDPELTLAISTIVENVIPKKSEIDKKALVVQILDKIFTLTDDEKTLIGSQIDYDYNNNKIIKISKWKIYGKAFSDIIKKFFLG